MILCDSAPAVTYVLTIIAAAAGGTILLLLGEEKKNVLSLLSIADGRSLGKDRREGGGGLFS